jgi:beta,beta-carotene 9',10'-dioxygenase
MGTTTDRPVVAPQRGFESLEQEARFDGLSVQGQLPPWLTGSLIRTGPAKWEVGGRSMNHWFDGLAMLHRFSFADGGVSYANRFLETRAWRAARDRGRIEYSEFATDPCRSLFQRVTAMFSPKISDNANVNLTKLGERFIAMTETPLPVQFDADTLAAAGVAYAAPGMLTTAHPHMDRETKGMLNYAARLGPRSSYRFFRLRPGATQPEIVATKPVREPAYMHSFGLTPRWLVLAEFPYVVNPLRLAFSGRPYIENYRWRPELGTRFHLFDRTSGKSAGPFETEARFGFHHVNSYEHNGEVVVDVCTAPDARIVEDLYLDRLR